MQNSKANRTFRANPLINSEIQLPADMLGMGSGSAVLQDGGQVGGRTFTLRCYCIQLLPASSNGNIDHHYPLSVENLHRDCGFLETDCALRCARVHAGPSASDLHRALWARLRHLCVSTPPSHAAGCDPILPGANRMPALIVSRYWTMDFRCSDLATIGSRYQTIDSRCPRGSTLAGWYQTVQIRHQTPPQQGMVLCGAQFRGTTQKCHILVSDCLQIDIAAISY